MKFGSITLKLLALVTGAFLISAFGVLMVADKQLKQIIDSSQDLVYEEKVDTILQTLDRVNIRLQKTGLVQAYAQDFKNSIVAELRGIHYQQPNQQIYPFIVDNNALIVMHPQLPAGSQSAQQVIIWQQLIDNGTGEITNTYNDVVTWYIFKKYEPWGWTIAYAVPLDIKYHDARVFIKTLMKIMAASTILVLVLFTIVLTRFTKPIIKLTQAASLIARGDLEKEITVDGKDEIGILAHNFRDMRNAIRQKITDLNHEIDERRAAEKEVRHLRNYLTNIIDSMPSVLIGVDSEGKVVQWNRQAQQTTGLSFEEACGQQLISVFPQLSDKTELIKTAIRNRQVLKDLKVLHEHKDEIRYEDVIIYPLLTSGLEGAVIRVDDITERVKIEEMMVQSKKMLSVGGLAAGMAHEINNPLAGIIQTSSVMKLRLQNLEMPANLRAADEIGVSMKDIKAFMDKRDIPRMLEAIDNSGQRVAEIVNNMLSFARKADAEVSFQNPVQLMDQILELAATDFDVKKQYDFKTIKIIKEYEEVLPMLPCESAKLKQVFLNVLTNGAQAMQSERPGKDIEACFVLRLSVEKSVNMLRIEIEDNGPGMDKETQTRIFEPFFTTKPPGLGTGLGLSVSYFIITENHNGTMNVESTPGNGATFIIRLPLAII